MGMIDLGYVLRRAWQITWRHKALWLFGLLASLGSIRWWPGLEITPQTVPAPVEHILARIAQVPRPVLLALALLITAAVGVGQVVLGALGRASLVDQVRAAENRGAVDGRAGWRVARRRLWPVVAIRLLLGLPLAVLVTVGALPSIAEWLWLVEETRPEVILPGLLTLPLTLFACLVPALCATALLSVPLGVVRRLAVRACVLEGLSVRASLARAWHLLHEHLGPLALVWFVVFVLGVGLVIVPNLPALALLLLMRFVAAFLPLALNILIGLLAWLAATAVFGVVETFASATWTLVYRELAELGLTGEEA